MKKSKVKSVLMEWRGVKTKATVGARPSAATSNGLLWHMHVHRPINKLPLAELEDHPKLHNMILGEATSVDKKYFLSHIERLLHMTVREDECVMRPFSFETTLDMMLQIAQAMKYIHSRRIYHRDLKPAKSLTKPVDNPERYERAYNSSVKLVDFETPKPNVEDTAHSHITANRGAVMCMAPELIKTNVINDAQLRLSYPKKADVRKFRIRCYEMHAVRMRKRHKLVSSRLGPELPESCPDFLACLICKCWDTDPSERPSFKEIVTTLSHHRGLLMLTGGGQGGPLMDIKVRFHVDVESKHERVPNRFGYDPCSGLKEALDEVPKRESNLMETVALGLDKVNVDTKLKGEPGEAPKAQCMAQLILRSSSSFLMETKAATESFILNAGVVDSDSTLPVEATRAEVDMPFKFHEFEPARKRIRIRPWSADETRALLEFLEEVSRVDAVPGVWDYVSDNLWDQYGFDRSPNSCESLWCTLLQSSKAQSHDDDFTNMEWECRELIGRIVSRKPNFEHCRSSTWMDGGGFYSYNPLPLMICPSQSSAGDEATDDDGMGSIDDEGFSGDSTSTIESQADSALTADIHSHGVSRITEPGCYETSSTYAGRKLSAADAALEDEIISKIAPLVKQQIEAALKPLLSALRSRVVK